MFCRLLMTRWRPRSSKTHNLATAEMVRLYRLLCYIVAVILCFVNHSCVDHSWLSAWHILHCATHITALWCCSCVLTATLLTLILSGMTCQSCPVIALRSFTHIVCKWVNHHTPVFNDWYFRILSYCVSRIGAKVLISSQFALHVIIHVVIHTVVHTLT